MQGIRIDHQLRQLNTYLNQYGKEHMKSLHMTSAQNMLLVYLLSEKKEKYCLTEISAELGLTKATVSAMLKALKKNGYLEISADHADERKKKIVLTDRALEKEEEIKECLRIRTERMLEGITDRELQSLEEILDKMIKNLKTVSIKRRQPYDKNTVSSSKAI